MRINADELQRLPEHVLELEMGVGKLKFSRFKF